MPSNEVIELLNGYHMHSDLMPHKHLHRSCNKGEEVFVPHRALNTNEHPLWVREMDTFIGECHKVIEYTTSNIVVLKNGEGLFNFKPEWLAEKPPKYLTRFPAVGDRVWLPHVPLKSKQQTLSWCSPMNEYIGEVYEVEVSQDGVIQISGAEAAGIHWNFWYEWFAHAEEQSQKQEAIINNVTVIKTEHWIGFIYPQKRSYEHFFASTIRSSVIIDVENNAMSIFSKRDGEVMLLKWKQFNRLRDMYHEKQIKNISLLVSQTMILLQGKWKRSIMSLIEDHIIVRNSLEKVWYGKDESERLTYYYKGQIQLKHKDEQKIKEIIRRHRYEAA
jgi:hypothetical protein